MMPSSVTLWQDRSCKLTSFVLSFLPIYSAIWLLTSLQKDRSRCESSVQESMISEIVVPGSFSSPRRQSCFSYELKSGLKMNACERHVLKRASACIAAKRTKGLAIRWIGSAPSFSPCSLRYSALWEMNRLTCSLGS